MSNVILAVQVYTVTKESINFRFAAKLHTSYSLTFWSCAGGAKTSVTSKNHVDSGLAIYN